MINHSKLRLRKMKNLLKNTFQNLFIRIFSVIVFMFLLSNTNAAYADDCYVTKINGGGFSTTISSVTANGSDYTIVLTVEHDGCPGPVCKELSHYSIEADENSYSNISVDVLSGGMTYDEINLGPNLGGDPFSGFKIDGTSGIGDGMAGIFTITYNLTYLQDQQTSAKAGGNSQIVEFTEDDFLYVLECTVVDTDNDGIPDDEDDYPNDQTRAFDNNYPAEETGTLAYEDLWPSKADYDFNDLVVDYQFLTVTNASNKIVETIGTFVIRAIGASTENGFGFQLANSNIASSDIIAVSGYNLQEGYINIAANGIEEGQTIPTIIVFDNAFNITPHPGSGIGVNTSIGSPYVEPNTVTIHITYTPDTYTLEDLDMPNFNPFLIKSMERGIEVHLPNYEPTDLVDESNFGTFDDDSNLATGKYYKTENNLPWAINIPQSLDYPIEKASIDSAFLHFIDWSENNGIDFQDWYMDKSGYRNNAVIYTH